MREIKFRAWDGSSMSQNAKTIQEIASVGVQSRDPEKLEWLQYTGLKDKNGKEIYEGDVFVGEWRPNPNIIKFDNGSFRDSRSGFVFDSYEASTSVVLGNIYENPELLK
jgi:hypothetical protein